MILFFLFLIGTGDYNFPTPDHYRQNDFYLGGAKTRKQNYLSQYNGWTINEEIGLAIANPAAIIKMDMKVVI